MGTFAPIDRWRQWSVTTLGALFLGTIVGTITIIHTDLTGRHLLHDVGPVLLALGLIAYGYWLVESDLAAERITRIALWSLAGALVLSLFATWEMYIHLTEGEPLFGTIHELFLGMTEGAIVGGVIGYYDVRRLEQLQQTKQAQQAISTSIDGMAILDEDSQYVLVNQAHADMYGYDDPEAMVGETWHMCYSEDELARIEEEIIPELFEQGQWRGEAIGLRADGSTFPQEISLTVMDNGGLVCVVRDITDQKRYEERLQTLHSVTRDFLAATTFEELTTKIVSAAHSLLGYPMTAVWEYDADADRLVPISAAEPTRRFAEEAGLQELPTLEEGSAEMEIFQDGDAVLVDDYRTLENRAATEVPLGSVLFAPVGDHGLLSIGAPEPGAIDTTDRFLGEILASNARAAVNRLERKQELEVQMERMEFFNSILRHDVSNGMTVIQGNAGLLADEVDDDQRRYAETILRWSEDIIDVVHHVRKTLDALTGQGDVQLQPTELSETLQDEIDRVRVTYPEVTFETTIPDPVHVRANDLLDEVLGNLITNAVEHNDTEGLRVSITASKHEESDAAIVRIADNGNGVPDEAKETIFGRDVTSGPTHSSGSGFGLFFVDSMVESYGGDVWVEDNDAGGATFVVELPLATVTTPA